MSLSLVYTRGVFFFVSRENYGDQSLIQYDSTYRGCCAFCLSFVWYSIRTLFKLFLMRAALSSFSLLRCRFFSNDVRRAVDERAGVQIRSVPAELKTVGYDAKCVHEEEEEEEEEEEVCRQFTFKRRRRRKEEEERNMKTKTKRERETHVDDLALFLGNDQSLSFGRRFRRRHR